MTTDTGDNRSCANGGPDGRFNSLYTYNQIPETLADQLKHLADYGGPHSDMTPALDWAIADNTPFALAQGTTSYGGTSNGVVVFWPKTIKAKGEIRPQYHHLIDVAPTVLEAAGLPQLKVVVAVIDWIDPAHRFLACLFFDDVRHQAWRAGDHENAVERRGVHAQIGEDGTDSTINVNGQSSRFTKS